MHDPSLAAPPSPAAPPRILGLFQGWWIVLTGLMALIVSGGLTTYVFSVLVKPMEDELGWSRSTIVGVLTLGNLVAGFLGAPMGPLFDKYGARGLMTASAILGGICFMLTGTVQDVWLFYLLLGVGEAATHPALHTLGPRTAIANWFYRKRPAAFAAYSMGRSISGITVVPLAAWLITVMSWRSVYLLVGLVEIVVLAPMCWAFIRRQPEDVGQLPDGDAQPPARSTAARAASAYQEPVWTRWQVLRTKAYWLIVVGFLLVSFPSASIFIHMASYLQDKGMTAGEAAFGLTVYGCGAVVARGVWTVVSNHLNVQQALAAFAFSYAGTIAAYTFADGPFMQLFAIFLLGGVIGGSAQLQSQVWPEYYGRAIVGEVTGYATLLNTPASASSPLILAMFYDATKSYTFILTVWIGLAAVAGLCFLTARKPAPPVQVAPAAG